MARTVEHTIAVTAITHSAMVTWTLEYSGTRHLFCVGGGGLREVQPDLLVVRQPYAAVSKDRVTQRRGPQAEDQILPEPLAVHGPFPEPRLGFVEHLGHLVEDRPVDPHEP